MRSTRHSLLMAEVMVMAMGSGTGAGAYPITPGLVTNADPDPYRHRPPERDTQLRREIADHNAAVEARKAAKKARKSKKEGV